MLDFVFSRILGFLTGQMFAVSFSLRMHISLVLFRLFACFIGILALESVPVAVKARPNPITSYTRLWAEWDVVPNTQWAPRSIDPSASQDRSLQIFKVQPVVPFRINDDWTVLTRTIFRFLSLPQADPVLGFSPAGLPAITKIIESGTDSGA